MKLATCSKNGKEFVCVITKKNTAVPVNENGFDYKDMNDLIKRADKESLKKMALLEDGGKGEEGFDTVKLEAPIPKPNQDIVCLGINYAEHAAESKRYKKEAFSNCEDYAVYFSKRVNRATADGDDIISHSDIISTLDYESELALIIGKDAKNVEADKVSDYIFGYTIINDVTARELQTRHKQWYFGKGLDGFTPMGPWIVTADEIEFPPKLNVKCYVNGELRQNSSTDKFIHTITDVMTELTKGMTLETGTIISTGTPSGVGMGFVPPKFLSSGDEVVCEIEKIGKITNKVK